MTTALVVLNPRARSGTALARFERVRPLVARAFALETTILDPESAWRRDVASAVDAGVRTFIAAGGDGTVSALAGALVGHRRDAAVDRLVLGAIGLGSSNDFHKPFAGVVAGVPLRLRAEAARSVHPTRLRVLGEDGAVREQTSIVSASIGVTARGNARFNGGGRVFAELKRRWVTGAVAYAALSAIAAHRASRSPCQMTIDGASFDGPFANVSVARTRHLAGPFAYDNQADPRADELSVNVCGAMDRRELFGAFALLAFGRFSSVPKAFHRAARSVRIEAGEPFELEVDGEVTRARGVLFDIGDQALDVCGR